MFDTRLYEAHILSAITDLSIPSNAPHLSSSLSPTKPIRSPLSSFSLLQSLRKSKPESENLNPESSSSSSTNSFMAQRTEKEETEFKVPETLTLCINNCGVTGNPATNNMCQKCFNATTSTSNSSTSTATTNAPTTTSMTFTSTIAGVSSEILKFTGDKSSRSTSSSRSPGKNLQKPTESTLDRGRSDDSLVAKREVTRCSGCRRKVGLTGFRCRCGELFCWEHRYSDRHECSYDYKAAGREAIARENPVVKAAKIVRV